MDVIVDNVSQIESIVVSLNGKMDGSDENR